MTERENRLFELYKLLTRCRNISVLNGVPIYPLDLSVHCLLRVPGTDFQKIEEFLRMILILAESGNDYTLLLKTGILAGMFPDYARFKKEKYDHFLQCKKDQANTDQLITFMEKLERSELAHPGYQPKCCFTCSSTSLVITIELVELKMLRNFFTYFIKRKANFEQYLVLWEKLPNFYTEFTKDLDFERQASKALKEGLVTRLQKTFNNIRKFFSEKIEKFLELDKSKWICSNLCLGDFEALTITISIFANTDLYNFKKLKEQDPICDGAPPFPSYVATADLDENEKWNFVGIYQRCLLEHHAYRIEEELKKLFQKRFKKSPNEDELEQLRQRFYRFIRRAYPKNLIEYSSYIYGHRSPRYLQGLSFSMRKKPFTFYLRRSLSARKKLSHYEEGALRFDEKEKCYWLMPYSKLHIKLSDAKKNKEIKLYKFFNEHEKRELVIKEFDGERFVLVRKRIKIESPSFAAQLVLGYKLNGLACWKNNLGQTIRDVLAIPKKSRPRKEKKDEKNRFRKTV